jgi:uncharacterized protein
LGLGLALTLAVVTATLALTAQPLNRREEWVDALRVLALLGVFLINGLGYAFSPAYPLQIGPPQPLHSPWALAVHGFVVACVQGKAWPLLSFLFGYSLCAVALSARAKGKNPKTVVLKRYAKLLLVGVLHGALLYFGDILTAYALCGLLVGAFALLKARRVVALWHLTWAMGFATVFFLGIILTAMIVSPNLPTGTAYFNSIKLRFGLLRTVGDFFALNSSSYLTQQLDSIFSFFPLVLWCMVAGILAKRFALLSQRRSARQFWQTHLGPTQLLLALACNIALAVWSVRWHDAYGYNERVGIVAGLSGVAGMWLAAAALGAAMRTLHRWDALPRWVLWLAPAGRHTLAMYLGLSSCLVLSGGAFFAFKGGTVATFSTLCSLWLAAVLLAKAASQRGLRDPVASWLSK